ncbi:OmpA family protein [Burkholderia sp. LA-2-3-30-S1-D2]|uniref:OmpA family protein n=1 Tax=Burkholderia sp. LA-2-3-30-S1-D2 TaxID=1637862 RepID=UPI00075BA493|nr:OmpA family protein [Burkholderia sp. LA-2-3-30-S1-D2]AOI95827.1 flagellar motor protein MotB [Burkholderia sp. LA-2-3-30-S1-D2]KVE16232.1 flagellar motor protein MotB [Burkholderia sp. LA-2-3-30-S1-D2]
MTSDTTLPSTATRTDSDAARAALSGLGYPLSTVVTLSAALALAVIGWILPLDRGVLWGWVAIVVALSALILWWHSRTLTRARERNAHVIAQLGAATADLPVALRTRMPLALVTGDGLSALFNRDAARSRFVHVGDGAIWLRADRPQDLPRLAVAVRQWRDGHAPDCIVLSVAPSLHANDDTLSQSLRVTRQAVADACRMLGTSLPGYVAIYQRLSDANAVATPVAGESAAQWYGMSTGSAIVDMHRFDTAIDAAESDALHADSGPTIAARATGIASMIGWTRRSVFDTLTDRRQPASPWPLFGACWIDHGPATGPGKPWEREVRDLTGITPAALPASPLPWPLPQPLIDAVPRQPRRSPRLIAVAHVVAIVACAAIAAICGAAKNNAALMTRIGEHLERYNGIPATRDAARRDALGSLASDRDQLDGYARVGVPLRLSFGTYRGAALLPILNEAIASYEPPAPPPTVVTLDSMSLFDSGKAQLKTGTMRAMVDALQLIKTHPGKRVLIAGYADDKGRPDRNLKLSIDRASAVRDWLVDASGIPPTQFAIQGYGDTRPVADNATPEGRAKNRRVEITLVPDTPAPVIPTSTVK